MNALNVRVIVAAAVLLGCSFPGVRPEGSTQTVNGSAPAAREAVFDRARQWFTRFGQTITSEAAGQRIHGYSVIERDAQGETRAHIEFTIVGSSSSSTSYRVFMYSRRAGIDAGTAVSSARAPLLHDWLSCPSARWPACP